MKKYLVLFTSILALSACGAEQIDTGNRGVKTWWGEITSEKPIEEGLWFYNPFGGDIIEYECKTQKYILEMSTYTKDIQTASMKVTVNYHLNGQNIIQLHREIGRDYQSKVMQPTIEAIVKDVIGRWDAASLVANREKATEQIEESLGEALKKYYIVVVSVSLNNIDYSDTFEQAIEAKVVATQKAEEAKNRTAEVEEQAKQQVLKAEAEAKAMKIKSDALAQNKSLVDYEAVLRWDGKLPVNYYSSAPVPFVKIK